MKIFGAVIAVSIFLFSGQVSAGDEMKEGLWEITVSMDMPGMPMKMPGQTYKQCLTKKEMIPQKEKKDKKCRMIKNNKKGDTVIWLMECKDKDGTTTIDGKATYKGSSFKGTVKVKHADGDITQHLSGRWIGQCK